MNKWKIRYISNGDMCVAIVDAVNFEEVYNLHLCGGLYLGYSVLSVVLMTTD